MKIYDINFQIFITLEAEDEIDASEKLVEYVKNLRFGEICDNASIRENTESEENANGHLQRN